MNKIRGMVIFCLSLIFISAALIFSIDLENINELILGALLGSLISIVITIFIEFTNYKSEQRKYRNKYFWEIVNPYRASLEEIFLYARDIYYMEFLFDGISKEEDDWRAYRDVYLSKKPMLDRTLIPYSDLILKTVNKNLNIISGLSSAISRIERKNFFGGESKYYQRAYKVYQIIENINWSLQEAYGHLLYIQNINDEAEKRCSQIIVFRWLSDLLCNNYDRGITDLTDDEVEKSFDDNEYKDLIAKKDLDLAINDYAKNIE